MKILVLFFTLLSASAYADVILCKPEAQSNWYSANVGRLESGSQKYLYQVTAHGVYLIADLICNSEECVGFVNGLKASGKIELSTSGPLKVVSFSISDAFTPKTNFNCEQ